MSFIDTVAAAFKGSGSPRVPLRQGYSSPWAFAFDRNTHRQPLDYSESVRRGFLANPIVQRAVRIVAEGVGQAPVAASDAHAQQLIVTTSAGQSLIETLSANILLHGNGWIRSKCRWSKRMKNIFLGSGPWPNHSPSGRLQNANFCFRLPK